MNVQPNPLAGWQVDRSQISTRGVDLQRPECILAEPDGTLWTADARGVMRIAADGRQTLIRQQPAEPGARQTAAAADPRPDATAATATAAILGASLPNGLAFNADGDILIDHHRRRHHSRPGRRAGPSPARRRCPATIGAG